MLSEEEIMKCPTCHIVRDGKVTDENYPLEELDQRAFYCKICGWLYTYDEYGELDALVNLKEKLISPLLDSILDLIKITLKERGYI